MFLRFNAYYSMEDKIKTFRFNPKYECYMNKNFGYPALGVIGGNGLKNIKKTK